MEVISQLEKGELITDMCHYVRFAHSSICTNCDIADRITESAELKCLPAQQPKQHYNIDQKDEGTQDDQGRDGGTNFILRIKEQETRLTLHEHDDDDDVCVARLPQSYRSDPYQKLWM